MKHIIILMDGMGDYPIESINNETPMLAAQMTAMNRLCKDSQVGFVKTIPDGMPSCSDVANLGILGYAPEIHHKGRGPFEAINLNIELKEDESVLRCNLITLSSEDKFLDKRILDPSGGLINDLDGKKLIHDLKTYIQPPVGRIVVNKGYKHLLILNDEKIDNKGPHEILDVSIKFHQIDGEWMKYYEKAHEFLSEHPINKKRVNQGLIPANGIWFWGAGKKTNLESFDKLHHKKSVVIASVDLILGLGKCANMQTIDVKSCEIFDKTEACISVLQKDYDFIFVHLEDADDASHEGNLDKKIEAIEDFDEDLVLPLLAFLQHQKEPFKVMILPDHITPVELRRHTEEPVPYMIYNSEDIKDGPESFHENMNHPGSINFENGSDLLEYFLK